MKAKRRWLVFGALIAAAAVACAIAWRPPIAPAPRPAAFDPALVARGAKVAAAANCMGCHTVDAARPYAGGYPVTTPFGTVHGTNITPDPSTGIGHWSLAAFERALREGVSRDGHLLYPAFPYNHYTRMAADDVRALYAYLMTRTPFMAPAVPNDMKFPFGWRPLLAGWNLLFLDRAPVAPDPARSAQWNRGAYLADAVAHCGACHTPRNALGGPDRGRPYAGGESAGWYVPALNAASPSPVPWTADKLAVYLRTGSAPGHAVAGGPMQKVVRSLARADRADVAALAAYFITLIGSPEPARSTAAARLASAPALPTPGAGDSAQLRLGAAVYADACARCHDAGRSATSGTALRLPLAVALHDPDPRSLIRIIREGIAPPDGEPGRTMPPFAGILTDAQLAALAAYLRRHGAGQPPWPDLERHVAEARTPVEPP